MNVSRSSPDEGASQTWSASILNILLVKYLSNFIFPFSCWLKRKREQRRKIKKATRWKRGGGRTGEFSRVSMNKVTGKTNKFAARHGVSKVRAGQKVIRRLLRSPQIPDRVCKQERKLESEQLRVNEQADYATKCKCPDATKHQRHAFTRWPISRSCTCYTETYTYTLVWLFEFRLRRSKGGRCRSQTFQTI